jgi:tetratricopeptide (TPR) repeat protein
MKLPLLLLVLFAACPLFAEKPKPTADAYFKKGEEFLAEHDVAQAKRYYRAALQLNPKHGNATFRLRSMKKLNENARIALRKQQLEKVKLPMVAFEDLTLAESIEALGVMVEKASDGTFIPNFVISDPSGEIADNTVNLKLRTTSASTVLKYLLAQANAKQSWDAHVISILPL